MQQHSSNDTLNHNDLVLDIKVFLNMGAFTVVQKHVCFFLLQFLPSASFLVERKTGGLGPEIQVENY